MYILLTLDPSRSPLVRTAPALGETWVGRTVIKYGFGDLPAVWFYYNAPHPLTIVGVKGLVTITGRGG